MAATPEPTTGSTPVVTSTSLPVVRTAPPPRPRASGAAILVALIAALVALGSAAVAVYALDQARQARSQANEARSIADRAAPSSAPAAVTPTASRPPASPTPSASRGSAFIAELTRTELKIPAPTSPCASVYVDLDKMTTGTSLGHEFYLSSCVGPLSFHVDRTSGTVTTANNPTPEACAAQITTESSGIELILPVVNGLTFCLVTNRADATAQGIPQRIAIVEVKTVGGDNSVTTLVSTYRVPGTP